MTGTRSSIVATDSFNRDHAGGAARSASGSHWAGRISMAPATISIRATGPVCKDLTNPKATMLPVIRIGNFAEHWRQQAFAGGGRYVDRNLICFAVVRRYSVFHVGGVGIRTEYFNRPVPPRAHRRKRLPYLPHKLRTMGIVLW